MKLHLMSYTFVFLVLSLVAHVVCVSVQSPMEEKAAMKEIHDALKQNYELINAAFTYYATGGSTSIFHMGLNNFTSFLEDCKVCCLCLQYFSKGNYTDCHRQTVPDSFMKTLLMDCLFNFPK